MPGVGRSSLGKTFLNALKEDCRISKIPWERCDRFISIKTLSQATFKNLPKPARVGVSRLPAAGDKPGLVVRLERHPARIIYLKLVHLNKSPGVTISHVNDRKKEKKEEKAMKRQKYRSVGTGVEKGDSAFRRRGARTTCPIKNLSRFKTDFLGSRGGGGCFSAFTRAQNAVPESASVIVQGGCKHVNEVTRIVNLTSLFDTASKRVTPDMNHHVV